MNEYSSWEITDFKIDGPIVLGDKSELTKICRSFDGKLLLVVDEGKVHKFSQDGKENLVKNWEVDSVLAFVLDIGVQRVRRLTLGSGFYFGENLLQVQSTRTIGNNDFDQQLFAKLVDRLSALTQSNAEKDFSEGVKMNNLFVQYNNARLLYPNFYAEGYLNLMRIVDALGNFDNAGEFAYFAADLPDELANEIYMKVQNDLPERIVKAQALFESLVQNSDLTKNWRCKTKLSQLTDSKKFIFSCLYSAYQYRNEYIHNGFSLPRKVIENLGSAEGGFAYLSANTGESYAKSYSSVDGCGDTIDVHVSVSKKSAPYKDTYYHLLPSWHFLKRMARQAMLNRINRLDLPIEKIQT